jgi:AcrR family transcriptional regulator
MSPRPRTVSDEELLAAACRAMSRVGPGALTLAEVGQEAGLSPSTLVQRFGSKKGLLLAVASRGADAVRENFAGLRAAHPSPLAALRAYGDCFAQMFESPGTVAHHLSYLQLDLTDPEFFRHTRAQARVSREALRDLLDAAVAAGELRATHVGRLDTAALARAVEVTLSGSLWTWVFHREGKAVDWVRQDLDALLRPYRAAARRPGAVRTVAARRSPRSRSPGRT